MAEHERIEKYKFHNQGRAGDLEITLVNMVVKEATIELRGPGNGPQLDPGSAMIRVTLTADDLKRLREFLNSVLYVPGNPQR